MRPGESAKYNSQELDKETNYYFYNARHYDPEICRFVTADTIIPYENETQSWNRFSYVRNNPIVYKDPTGHKDRWVAEGSDPGLYRNTQTGSQACFADKGSGPGGQAPAVKNQVETALKGAKVSSSRCGDYKSQLLKSLSEKPDAEGNYSAQMNGKQITFMSGFMGDRDSIKDKINKTEEKAFSVLDDAMTKVKLDGALISTIYRPDREKPNDQYPHSAGLGFDIAAVSKGGNRLLMNVNAGAQPGEAAKNAKQVAKELTSALRDDTRTAQILGPWEMVSKGQGAFKFDEANKSATDPATRGGTDLQHRNHIHVGVW